ncbi:hypothetical protein SAMN05444369_10865 [Capnocytophaga haemolytica]|jgi:hypothetical protein|uniref:DUF4190 domain-containing protein n=1 Tax=Capnocytophaga haemolytica TaxID=45243 RepID=A0AAX2H1E6_9FLAO|nr:hypothetical protein [Capnocytophaga haemolytica]AMD84103.1 hypothetical protein AXF12_00235 [Capnocytophaga haemolytica]SFO06795.1 hypothetical protein SAMN05444369_10865 [Capnocytophaga haemolytica]SNV13469.1 Uncharacterised protein [Capnocytophaga haemolytica]
MSTEETQNQNQPIYVVKAQSNGIGTAGFVISLVNVLLGFIPFINFLCFVLWPLGLVFSIVGLFKQPKGLAIAGLVISLFFIIIGLLFLGFLGITAAASSSTTTM